VGQSINQSLVYYTIDKPQPANTSTDTIKIQGDKKVIRAVIDIKSKLHVVVYTE